MVWIEECTGIVEIFSGDLGVENHRKSEEFSRVIDITTTGHTPGRMANIGLMTILRKEVCLCSHFRIE